MDTRVFLKQAFAAHGFKGGTRSDTKLSQRVAREKEQLAAVMRCHGIEWEQKGTHEKHLSVLDFEKKERTKEVTELEQIRKEGQAIRQKASELSATNVLLKEQAETLAEDKEKLLSDNSELKKQQKKQ